MIIAANVIWVGAVGCWVGEVEGVGFALTVGVGVGLFEGFDEGVIVGLSEGIGASVGG